MHVYQLLQLIHLSLHISTFPSSSTCYICCLVSICVCLCAKLQGVQHARGRQAKFSQLVSEQQASLERFPLCSRTMDGWNYCECGPNISQFSAAFIPSSFARRNWTNVPLYHSLYLFLLLLLSTNAYISDSVDFFWFCLLLAMVTSFLLFTGSVLVFFECLETGYISSLQFLFLIPYFSFFIKWVIYVYMKWDK